MSEYINNREYRQKVLKELIMELHNGKTVDEVKERFEKLIEGVSAAEISMMENQLIREGLPVSEVQRLCDVHAAVFKGSIEEIHMPDNPAEIPGHPVHTFKMENRALERHMEKSIKPVLNELKQTDSPGLRKKLLEEYTKLYEVDKHYLRKENLLFPFLEKYGITAPPKVMWGVDDEIREDIKNVLAMLRDDESKAEVLVEKAEAAMGRVSEMIFKEENILFPMAMDTLNEDEWMKIARESSELGYCLYEPKKEWKPARVNVEEKTKMESTKDSETEAKEPDGDDRAWGTQENGGGYIAFETGVLSQRELEAMLNTLPVDITFVDKDGIVKYFSQGTERIFPRTKAVIGRTVTNCHPPASVHIVEKIVEDLKSGKKDHEDFWIKMKGMYVLIRYFAVRDRNGEFVGVLEFTQNIAPLKEIEGEKRLLSE
jgi:PAS domain S-box-containing protein